jgi:hypothetical protein
MAILAKFLVLLSSFGRSRYSLNKLRVYEPYQAKWNILQFWPLGLLHRWVL